MNKKQSAIDKILEAVLECCNMDSDGATIITAEMVRSKDRHDNVLMTRCIFVTQMMFMGYSRCTTAAYLHRDQKSIGNILAQAEQYRATSRAYRIADSEVTLKLKELNLG